MTARPIIGRRPGRNSSAISGPVPDRTAARARALRDLLKNQMSAIVDFCDDAIIAKTLDGIIVAWNPAAERMYGYSAQEAIGKPITILYPQEASGELALILWRIRRRERIHHFETVRVRKDGSRIHVSLTISPILGPRGRVLGASVIARDITAKKIAEEEARQREAHLRLLIEQVPVAFWTTDRELRITSCGGSALAAIGLKPNQFEDASLFDREATTSPETPAVVAHRRVLAGERVEYETSRLGRVFHARVETLRDAKSNIIGCIGVALDITERKKSEERVQYLATHDSLTDLGNYRLLVEAFDGELRRSDRTGRPFCVLLLDLDALKTVNDQYGHLVGSRALCRLARVLRGHCRSIDTAARYGGDEFAVLLVETEKEVASRVAERIAEQLAADGERPPLSVSIGVAMYPGDGRTTETLLAAADRALYAKKSHIQRSASSLP